MYRSQTLESVKHHLKLNRVRLRLMVDRACLGCAVPPDASALLADPHRYVGRFQGLVHGFGQVIPD
jgi:hypothetical protein